MPILELQGWVMIGLEIGVVGMLIVEFLYDKNLNEHIKRMKKRAKRRYEFENINEGEHH